MDTKKVFKVGSRKSELALIQTNLVVDELKNTYPNKEFEIITMSTIGDQILDIPLPKIGEKSLFTKELEEALKNNVVDLVVHSLKDMPTSLPEGLAIGAILEREDPRDALVLHSKHRGLELSSLPDKSVLGTSSLRRTAQLKRKHPNLIIKDIRGNLQTRLRKLDKGDYDGIILAVAGIQRMGWEHRISQVLDNSEMLYAVGQGALAVECRVEDSKIFSTLNHLNTVVTTLAERSLLCQLGGGCSAPVAVCSKYKDDILKLTAGVWSLDGQTVMMHDIETNLINNSGIEKDLYCGFADEGSHQKSKIRAAYKVGVDLAQELIEKGALKIINEAKAANAIP